MKHTRFNQALFIHPQPSWLYLAWLLGVHGLAIFAFLAWANTHSYLRLLLVCILVGLMCRGVYLWRWPFQSPNWRCLRWNREQAWALETQSGFEKVELLKRSFFCPYFAVLHFSPVSSSVDQSKFSFKLFQRSSCHFVLMKNSLSPKDWEALMVRLNIERLSS